MPKNLFIVFALAALLAATAWAGSGDADKKANEDQYKAQETEYEAHRQYVKIHFNDDEMDFGLQWVLGSISNGGCELGEALYTISQIKDGSPESWQKQWRAMGERVEALGDESLAAGHKISAREQFIRAANYYRTALVSMMPGNPDFKPLGDKIRSTFKKGAKLFDPPMEYFEIPFEGTVLPGYFRKVDGSGKKRKTLIMIGGGETFAEELYTYIGPKAIKRGYNFITVDIPGQGMLPAEGKFFRPDPEVPLKAVLDYALKQPEVDPERLGMYGISGGGYFVPRTATVDDRIKAIALNSAVVDEYTLFTQMPNAKATPEELKTWGQFHKNTAGVVSWRWGLDPTDIIGLAEANKGYVFDPSKIKCPLLILIGEGEYSNKEIQRQQHACLEAAQNSQKKLVVTKANVGASSHCIGENRSLMSEVVFNWFDEIFD